MNTARVGLPSWKDIRESTFPPAKSVELSLSDAPSYPKSQRLLSEYAHQLAEAERLIVRSMSKGRRSQQLARKVYKECVERLDEHVREVSNRVTSLAENIGDRID